jgi:hypothetical protein
LGDDTTTIADYAFDAGSTNLQRVDLKNIETI